MSAVTSPSDSFAPWNTTPGDPSREPVEANQPARSDVPPSDFLTPHRLSDARRRSYLRLEWMRKLREKVIRAFAGTSAEDQADTPSFVNLVEQGIDTLAPQLVSLTPKCSVTAIGSSSLEGAAQIRELSLNRTAKDIKLGNLHAEAVVDALLGGWAIVRTGLKAGTELCNIGDKQFRKGIFYATLIDLDDYVIDQAARRDGEPMFEGHRYRVPRQAALDSELYDNEIIKALPPLRLGKYEKGTTEDLSGRMGDPFLLLDMIELWDIAVYVGDTTMICTLSDSKWDAWVRKPYQYWGPGTGPYVKLSFSKLPNSAIPKVWGARMVDIAAAIDEVCDKAVDDMLTDKTVNAYRGGEENAADAVREARNQDWVKVEDPKSINSIRNGGLSDTTIKGLQALFQWWNRASLSPDVAGDVRAEGETATGASIRQGNSTIRLKQMQAISMEFLSEIFRHMGWYKDSDPMLQETVVARIDGGEQVELLNTAQLRRGDFADFNYETDAYPSSPIDPNMRLARFMDFIEKLPPLLQLGQSAFAETMKLASKAMEEPGIDKIQIDPEFSAQRDQMSASLPPSGAAQPGAVRAAPQRINQVRSDMSAGALPVASVA